MRQSFEVATVGEGWSEWDDSVYGKIAIGPLSAELDRFHARHDEWCMVGIAIKCGCSAESHFDPEEPDPLVVLTTDRPLGELADAMVKEMEWLGQF